MKVQSDQINGSPNKIDLDNENKVIVEIQSKEYITRMCQGDVKS